VHQELVHLQELLLGIKMAMELGQTAFGRLPPRYLRNGSFWKSRWCRNDGVVQLRVLKLRNSYYARFSKKAELVSLAGLGLGKARAAGSFKHSTICYKY
jgi:hypothetical protein